MCGAARAELFDLATAARPCCSEDLYQLQTTFDYRHRTGVVQVADGRWMYGLQWAEERDIEQVRLQFTAAYDAKTVVVQYWFNNWPYEPPKMPTIEDPVDDPWQGKWLNATTEVRCQDRDCR
jgi:hypothetical protein